MGGAGNPDSRWENPLQLNHTLSIYDTRGKVVRTIENITSYGCAMSRRFVLLANYL
jgi:hypothetical protein